MKQKEPFDRKEAVRKFNVGLGQMLEGIIESRNDITIEEIEWYYGEVCQAFRRFLRYYRCMNYFKVHDDYMMFSVNLAVILVKKFNGKLVIDESGDKEAVIELQSAEGPISVNPFSLIRRTYDSEDWDGSGKSIEEICKPFSVAAE
jgi:hypothetical protein